MKTIGLIGGISWHSTLDYYRLLNELVNQQLGGVHSAKIILYSVDFDEIKTLTEKEDWDSIAAIMCKAAKTLEAGGADCLLIAANTMHNIAHKLVECIQIPLIHIAEAIGSKIREQRINKVALLGTKYTMQMDFYKDKLSQQQVETIIPGDADINFINASIYEEFGKGLFLPGTRNGYIEIINKLIQKGAEGVIFGCTEIPILLKETDCGIPVFDSAFIHCRAAVDFALR